jgi:hypothetical protein
VERAVLPRLAFVNWQLLADRLKALKMDEVSIAKYDSGNLEVGDFELHLMLAFQRAGTRVLRFPLSADEFRYFGRSSSGLFVITADNHGQSLAEMLWQEFQIGGGSASVFPDIRPDIPRDLNCLVIGPSNWGTSPPSGQAGEGLDQYGRPVPAPQ